MYWRRPTSLGALLAVALFAEPQLAETDASDRVVVRVGSSELPISAVERRLRALPAFQLRALGKSQPEVRNRVVQELFVPEMLHAEEARRLQLEKDPAVRARLDEVLRQAMQRELRERLLREDPITDEEVRRYFEANRARFETPRRIRIWRILVDDEKLARRIAADAQGKDGPGKWSAHARQHSRDRATAMRKGDLGFVRQDGRTDVPRVRVDPALFAAADTVEDGEVVGDPVAEGKRLAVVWRRGSLPAVSRSLEQEEHSIRQILLRDRLRDAVDSLVGKLSKKYVRGVDESLLRHLTVPAPDFRASRRPTASGRPSRRSSPVPRRGERGLR